MTDEDVNADHEYIHGDSATAFLCHVDARGTEITPDRFDFCPFCGGALEDDVIHTEVDE